MKYTLYVTHDINMDSEEFMAVVRIKLIILLLKYEGITFTTVIDRRKVMTLSHGHANPACGAILVCGKATEEIVIRDVYDLMNHLDRHGLRQC
jgi:hypothetical protein